MQPLINLDPPLGLTLERIVHTLGELGLERPLKGLPVFARSKQTVT